MKRIALLVLALIANVIADDKKDMEEIALDLQTNVQDIELCLSKVGTTLKEIGIEREKLIEIEEKKDAEEMKKSIMEYSRFLGCIMERMDVMKDTKIVLDKLLEMVHNDKNAVDVYDEEILSKCVISLNEEEMAQEDRSFGLLVCFITSEKET